MWELDGAFHDGTPICDLGDDWDALLGSLYSVAAERMSTNEIASMRVALTDYPSPGPGKTVHVAATGCTFRARGL